MKYGLGVTSSTNRVEEDKRLSTDYESEPNATSRGGGVEEEKKSMQILKNGRDVTSRKNRAEEGMNLV